MIEILDTAARAVGYLVLACVSVVVLAALWFKFRFRSKVSPEAKQMAKEVDPNNPVSNAAAEVMFDGILDGIRDLQDGETIRADPEPLTHFDWSVDTARQEDIEHILSLLNEAGYYTHPLPDVDEWKDEAKWSRERAGVWRSEPDWRIVEYHEDGSKELKQEIDLPIPEQWRPRSE
jgi:hypothetical protein